MAGVADEWLNRLDLAIEFMAQLDFAGALTLDYTAASLTALTTGLAERVSGPLALLDDSLQPLLQGAVAYAGECFIRLSRGHWVWEDTLDDAPRMGPTDPDVWARVRQYRWRFEEISARGAPVVCADPALGLDPVSPLHLVMEQMASRGDDPGALVRAFADWSEAISAHAAAQPEWTVVTEPTLSAGGMVILPPSPVLDEWLVRRREHFPHWAASYPGPWDFSSETVEALSELVFRLTPTVDAFEDPVNAEFSETASWYYGEVLCRAYPSRWAFREYLHTPGDSLAVCFTVQTNDNLDYTSPYVRLAIALKRQDRGRLRSGYDRWAETP
ncbi:hypothetical protein [Mycobacterium sp. NPDC006124]|uniref:hypothetical protein n=1 Tax=Mycobacterium sp. NPDC006124 TaxID=3156729 RepID=UPI0033BBFA51